MSFLDAALALSIMPRAPVFAIDRTIAHAWWVKPFLRFAQVVPLDPTKPLGARTLINAVKSGEPLVIFPEGRLTVTGSLMKVYDGVGLIADKSGAEILPVRIEGPEATIFSRVPESKERRRLFPKFKLTVLEPTRLAVDEELKGRKRRAAAGLGLYHIMSDLLFLTTDVDRTIFQATVEAARHHGASRVALEDPVTGKLSYRKLLTAARALGEKIAALTEPGETVGLMLPNANGAGVAFLALTSAGRVPAMVNFTAGSANILAGLKGAGAKRVTTSRAFIEAARLEKLVEALTEEIELLYLEDVRERVTSLDKLRALLLHRRALVPRGPDAVAAVLFTSGSEGAPKGVALSHRNMLTNVAQAAARIDFSREDKLFNVLPIFHCFGLTAGFVLPLVSGVPIYLYPSPLHYRIVPELVYGSNATILFGTDTFLAGYARTANAYDFRSIRYVVAGAEPVKENTRDVWSEKFGVRILEGYGVTETAPVLALNTPMHNKFGTVGRLVPGVEPRLERVDGVDGAGRLHVRGPNVMMGYLRAENPGVLEPPKDGWHDTGDIVAIDEEGFVTIKGRAKRFAKIGGEMVSLARIEALAGELWPDAMSAAASEPDPRKGERIVLATQHHGRDARGVSGLRQKQGSLRTDDPGGDHHRRVAAASGLRQARFRRGDKDDPRAGRGSGGGVSGGANKGACPSRADGLNSGDEAANALNGRRRLQRAIGDPQRASLRKTKGVARDRGDAMFADEALDIVQRLQSRSEAQEKVEGAGGRRNLGETCALQLAQFPLHRRAGLRQRLDLFLHERASRAHGSQSRVLRDDRRANDQRVLNFQESGFELGGKDHPADTPAREAIGLRHRIKRNRVSGCAGNGRRREVARAVIGEILIGLVVDVIEAMLRAKRIHGAQCRFGIYGAGWIVRRNGDDCAGAWRDRRP